MKIRAAVLREPGTPVAVEVVELDEPRPDEVRVRVAAAGVCRSDLHLADGALGEGRWPMVLGHEGAGVVERVGERVTHVREGDRVAFCFVPPCRSCVRCREGRFNLCEPAGAAGTGGTLLDGTSRLHDADGRTLQHCLLTSCFAERTVVPGAGAVPLPDSVPLWQAALLGCGVVTGIGAVRNTARVRIGESVCVVGCGGVGLQVVAGARLAGAATIVAVDRDPEKLELARGRGATHVVEASNGDTAAAVRALTNGGVDHAFEVVGRPETMRLAWDAIHSGGVATVVGLAPVGVEVSLPAIEFLSEKSIRGCYYGSANVAVELPELVQLVADERLSLGDVVSHFTDLEGVSDALERLRRNEGARTIVVVDSDLAEVES
ncbi:MAG TPA: alcohol dehydrogenase catalytic domain-containing protein [Gaiellaceae bacterium]|nr:alcohol dehydrogenase catalytic domain-containing protein [Gaiellaceae bacterium]